MLGTAGWYVKTVLMNFPYCCQYSPCDGLRKELNYVPIVWDLKLITRDNSNEYHKNLYCVYKWWQAYYNLSSGRFNDRVLWKSFLFSIDTKINVSKSIFPWTHALTCYFFLSIDHDNENNGFSLFVQTIIKVPDVCFEERQRTRGKLTLTSLCQHFPFFFSWRWLKVWS